MYIYSIYIYSMCIYIYINIQIHGTARCISLPSIHESIHVERPQRQERTGTRGALHHSPKPQTVRLRRKTLQTPPPQRGSARLSSAPSGLWKLEESIQIWFPRLHLHRATNARHSTEPANVNP